MKKILTGIMTLMALAQSAAAAIGCTLSNPARDLKSLYPEMTSYREDVRELPRMPGGAAMYAELQERIGGDLDPVYEAFDTPYTLYSIFKDNERIGYVHGVNVPGRGGVIQLFVSVDPASAEVTRLFFQRLESPGGRLLRANATREQFKGLTLADFYKHDYFAAAAPDHPSDKVARLTPPAALPAAARPDWDASLRGLRKNLILLDFFAFDRRNEPFYQRALEAREKKEKTE